MKSRSAIKTSIPESDDSIVKLVDVIAALSHALDITEGQPEGHAIKSCLIAMRIAETIGLGSRDRSALFYGTLIKDAGCSSNAAKMCSLFGADDRKLKRDIKVTNWRNPLQSLAYVARHTAPENSLLSRAAKIVSVSLSQSAGKEMIETRCSRGADIARKLGFPKSASEAIQSLDEHWDGHGEPLGLKGDQIPLLGRIACLAQTIEVYFRTYDIRAASDMARQRSGVWFDPGLVKAFQSLENDSRFWHDLNHGELRTMLSAVEPEEYHEFADSDRLDAISEGFAEVVDAKSPWTYSHSLGVANATVGTLNVMGYGAEEVRYWRRAALLHDIGKLGVSNLILDKPGKLTDAEFDEVKKHVVHTKKILMCVPCFRGFAEIAAAHHEKLDGSGYALGLSGDQLSNEARVLAVADIFDALSARRPYRQVPLELDDVFSIMAKDVGSKICPVAFDALKCFVESGNYQPTAAPQLCQLS